MSLEQKLTTVRVTRSLNMGDWSADYDGDGALAYEGIEDESGKVLALVVAHAPSLLSRPDTELVSRRLVACWNACIGLSIGDLERVGQYVTKQEAKPGGEARRRSQEAKP